MAHVVCTKCNATNRIADSQAAAQGKRCQCRTALFDGHPANLAAPMLEKQIGRRVSLGTLG